MSDIKSHYAATFICRTEILVLSQLHLILLRFLYYLEITR